MKKLQRLIEDRKIAGICGGLGEYFDLDPVFFRLFFLVSLLFGGIGALAYLLLWILVPEKTGVHGEPRPVRRLHLSNSDRKLAGVCGGLGELLEVDSVFFRVAFVVLALVCGLGILAYIVLWLVIPRASTLAEAASLSRRTQRSEVGLHYRLKTWWAMQGSNLRPLPCEGSALPLS